MLTPYCSGCWRAAAPTALVCPHCGTVVERSLDRDRYIARLVAALSRRERTAPLRAASILARLDVREAVGPLAELLKGPALLLVKVAALEALGKIGGRQARTVLEHHSQRGSLVLRLCAQKALRRVSHESAPAAAATTLAQAVNLAPGDAFDRASDRRPAAGRRREAVRRNRIP